MKTKKKTKSKSAKAGKAQLVSVPAFTDVEEEFFRAGDAVAHAAQSAESFDDLDVGYERPGLLRRLFSRAA